VIDLILPYFQRLIHILSLAQRASCCGPAVSGGVDNKGRISAALIEELVAVATD
jgi:hypothetical protein